jgi:prepilin-type N-terminal cleavage/methylation domain-containing protein
MSTMRRRGFSLVELLVVIAVVAILVGLLVPAVQKIRETACRVQCQHNLKQVALAVNSYHDVAHKFPPYAAGVKDEIYGSWLIGLLPYLDQVPLYEKIDGWKNANPSHHGMAIAANGVRDATYPFLRCPADPSANPSLHVGTTNYLANWFALTRGNKGAFSDPRRLIDLADGPSNVVLFGEAYSICNSTARIALDSVTFHNFGITPTGKPSDDPSFLPKDYTWFQVQPRLSPGPDGCDFWRTQTPHAMMNVALADGSVRAINSTISRETWKFALKPDDGHTLGADWSLDQ